MAERVAHESLLGAISESGYRSSIITTYNCYFPFFEEVVLRRLFSAGCIHNILFMDAARCAEAFSKEETIPHRAGHDYVLIPVKMSGAFHPKIIFQVGKNKGMLHVGSHNMTYSGFGLNDEITNIFRYNNESGETDTIPFKNIYEYLIQYVPKGLPELLQAYEGVKANVSWLRGETADTKTNRIVLTNERSGDSLWDQLVPLLPKKIKKTFISGPFFDEKLELVKKVLADSKTENLTIGIDPKSSDIDFKAATLIPKANFVNIGNLLDIKPRRSESQHYMHAKIMWFKGSEEELLVTGSANPSAAAFLAPFNHANAETIVADFRKGSGELLGINDLLGAPKIIVSDWEEIKERVKDLKEDKETSAGKIWIAKPTIDGFEANEAIPKTEFKVFDENGKFFGEAQVAGSTEGTRIKCLPAVSVNAHYLKSVTEKHNYLVLIHVHEKIGVNFGSESRQSLLQVLGTIEDDPFKLENLMILTEKVIFDSDDIIVSATLRKIGKKSDETPTENAPTSLAVDAIGRKGTNQRQALATGDISILLDALLNRLGVGLSDSDRQKILKNEEETQVEGVLVTSVETPVEGLSKVARFCRSKVGRLIKLMEKRLELATDGKQARQCIVQLAVVLAIVRALRKVEKNETWKEQHLKLVEKDDENWLFRMGVRLIAWKENCLLQNALIENKGEIFSEWVTVIGLLSWLAWENGIDLEAIKKTKNRFAYEDDEEEVDETELYYEGQLFVSIGKWLFENNEALKILKESIVEYSWDIPRDDTWIDRHLKLFKKYENINSNSSHFKKTDRIPKAGDLIILGKKSNPRVRVILEVQFPNVIVFEPEAEKEKMYGKFVSTGFPIMPWIESEEDK